VLELTSSAFQRIAGLMFSNIGLQFTDNKRPLMASRLATRVQRLGLASYDDYADLLERPQDGGEFQMAIDLLTTNETYFFREPAHFEFLERELRTRRPPTLSVWSAAASFGDEPYSVAMLLSDLQQQGALGADWSILGTDISDRVLHSAVQAVYPAERLRHVSEPRLKRYCLRGEGTSEGQIAMHPLVRHRVHFGQLNLCAPIEDVGNFDVVFLRNVLIYFDAPTKSAVVDRVLTQLKPGGLLFLGTAEGRVPCRTPLTVLGPGIFRKADAR
jgi:chemotaxis protein methyltransferase CheR